MKNPKKFGSTFGVLNASMFPISLLYTFVGLLGYLKYGESTTGSITLDMPQTEVYVLKQRVFVSNGIRFE